jgi:hypothetical protein
MPIPAQQGVTLATDPARAVAELAEQIGGSDLDVVFMFCSSTYDLDSVAERLQATFRCPIVACSSSGQIGPAGFQRGGMTAMSLRGGCLKVVPHLIQPLADYQDQALRVSAAFRESLSDPGSGHTFGFLVIDGLSMMEERVASALYQALDNVPIIGGSAGDDLAFQKTQVYFDGRFRSDAAVFAACEARGPVVPFMLKHFSPGGKHLVITDSDPDNRVIREFNGEPAAQVYAETIGIRVEDLNPMAFSGHPLFLKIGEEHFVRSIAKVNPDLSLTLYCAIDTGRVVTIGKCNDPLAALDQAFGQLKESVPDPIAILACDCILRRLEFETLGLDREVGEYLARHRVFGFSTYGEQINGLHVNQTLTGIALGRETAR